MKKEDLIPVQIICQTYGLETSFIKELSDFDLLEITIIEDVEYIQPNQLGEMERFIRLYFELEINPQGIVAITHLLEKIDSLNAKIIELNRDQHRDSVF